VLPFLPSFVAIVAALVIPSFVGILIISGAAKAVNTRYLAAFAFGLYFWFFSDTIGDAAFLDVNSGFGGGAVQVALVLLFIIGMILIFSLDRDTFRPGPSTAGLGFGIPLLVAFAVGFHGFGEGAAFTATAATTPATGLLDAFGGASAAAAFIIHKALEPMMIGAAYWVYAKDHAKDLVGLVRDIAILTVVFVLPGVVGAATDYYWLYDTTYFFAFGLGTSVYAAVRLVKPLFSEGGGSKWESTKIAVAVVLGFLCLYGAALLHA
jgi:zinc transporter ZupT